MTVYIVESGYRYDGGMGVMGVFSDRQRAYEIGEGLAHNYESGPGGRHMRFAGDDDAGVIAYWTSDDYEVTVTSWTVDNA
jgi:hypothetical protein